MKTAGFLVSASNAPLRVYKLAEQRPDVREAQAASQWPGSVVPPFLFSTPTTEAPYA